MVIYTSISRDVYTSPASPVPAQHPARPCNLVRALHSLTRAKPPAQAGSGRQEILYYSPGDSVSRACARSWDLSAQAAAPEIIPAPQSTSLPSIPSHCTNTNTSLLFSLPFSLPRRGLEVAEKNPHGSASRWLVTPSVFREGQERPGLSKHKNLGHIGGPKHVAGSLWEPLPFPLWCCLTVPPLCSHCLHDISLNASDQRSSQGNARN